MLVAEEKNLKALFEPKSVAVIGASRNVQTVGYAILHNLIEGKFKGRIYPVNPKVDELEGLKCYHSILEIPEPIDLAVIIIQSKFVPETMQQCAQKGVQAAIVISAGFKEVGGEGVVLEKEVAQIAKDAGICVLGPNCLGSINTDPFVSVNASFSKDMPKAGNIAFISQSGAFCTAILDYAKGENIGFSKFVSMGNKADINEIDFLKYLKDDPKTDVILLYLEDIIKGKEFIEIARQITTDPVKPKPILALKSGRTAQGAKAAASHTGSLMGSDEVYNALFKQAGIVRVDSAEEMFDFAVAFAYEPVPKGNRVVIVTNAGGPGIMATDACVKEGLEIAELDKSTKDTLRPVLPAAASVANPVDVIGDATHERYEKALEIIAKDSNVDSVFIIITPQSMTDCKEIADVIVEFDSKTDLPVIVSFMGAVDVDAGAKVLENNQIPNYRFPEAGATALGAMCRFRQWLNRPQTQLRSFTADHEWANRIIEEARKEGRNVLPIHQSMEIFKAYGLPVPPFALASSEADAVAKAKTIGYPVVLKIVSPQAVHKVDMGGVELNLKSDDEVKLAYQRIVNGLKSHYANAQIEGVFVQAMAQKGKEVILGMNRDKRFGPVLMFGLGGIYVEVLKDVVFRLAPLQEMDAKNMIEAIKTYSLLKGVRGEKPVDIEAVSECLQRLSQLSCDQPSIMEMDINPLFVYTQGQGAAVLDARIVIG